MKYIDMLLSIKILDAVLCLLLTFEKVNKGKELRLESSYYMLVVWWKNLLPGFFEYFIYPSWTMSWQGHGVWHPLG